MLPDCPEFQSQNVQISGYVFHDTNGQNHGQTLKAQLFLLNEICPDTHLLASCEKGSSRKFQWNSDGEKYQIVNVYLFIEKQGIFLSVYVDDVKMDGKKQNMAPMWKKLLKHVDLDEPTSFLDHVFLGCTQRECKPNEIINEEYRKMFESQVSAGATEKVPGWRKTSRKKTVAWSYDMEGHAQKCVERCCELANKKTEQLYKVSSPCFG